MSVCVCGRLIKGWLVICVVRLSHHRILLSLQRHYSPYFVAKLDDKITFVYAFLLIFNSCLEPPETDKADSLVLLYSQTLWHQSGTNHGM